MKQWRLLCCIQLFHLSGKNAENKFGMPFLPGKSFLSKIPEFLGPTTVDPGDFATGISGYSSMLLDDSQVLPASVEISSLEATSDYTMPNPPDSRYPVQHAGLPQGMAVYPIPLEGADHELQLNVTWLPAPPFMLRPRDYSIEVRTLTNTTDCRSPMCYEYNIPGENLWWLVPTYHNPVAQTCAVRPGCDYRVRLIAHPWDGHTAANLDVQMDECVAGVCSCGHAPRLPAPAVSAGVLSIHGELFANISWTLPPPRYPRRLPPALQKEAYYVSIGKQMVSNAHPSPWFANTVARKLNTSGAVSAGDNPRWILLPISERSGAGRDLERSGAGRDAERSEPGRDAQRSHKQTLVLDVKLLARVYLIDDRGCVGPAGNATAYDPAEANTVHFGTYVLWAALGGACMLATIALLAVSARGVKRVLRSLRPAPVAAPLEPLLRRPAWFPMQLRSALLLPHRSPSERNSSTFAETKNAQDVTSPPSIPKEQRFSL